MARHFSGCGSRQVGPAAKLLAGVLLLLGLGRAAAGDNTWTNAAANSLWDITSSNWTAPAVWSNTNVDDAIFGATGAGAITVNSAITVRGMQFVANGYTVNPTSSHP